MIPADETFDGTWPFAPHFSTSADFRQHYVDEGPRDGEVVLDRWGHHKLCRCIRATEPRNVHQNRKALPLFYEFEYQPATPY